MFILRSSFILGYDADDAASLCYRLPKYRGDIPHPSSRPETYRPLTTKALYSFQTSGNDEASDRMKNESSTWASHNPHEFFFIIQKSLDSCRFLLTPCAKQFPDANNLCNLVDFISNNMFRFWGPAFISASVINTVDMFRTDKQMCVDTVVEWFLTLPHSIPVAFSTCFLYLLNVHAYLIYKVFDVQLTVHRDNFL